MKLLTGNVGDTSDLYLAEATGRLRYFQVCRCAIGVVLDANMDPVEPYRAARLEDC